MTAPDETHGRPASEPRHEVETVWDARIPARDGVELSANLWLPRPVAGSASAERFPVVLQTLTMTASDADPAHATLDADVVYQWREHAFETEIRARSTQTSGAKSFHLTVDLEVDGDGEPFFRRAWNETIARRLV